MELPTSRLSDEVSALSRGIAILKCLADASEPMSNRQITQATAIPKASVSRLTATLVANGMVQQCALSERFSLSAGVLELSHGYLSRLDVRVALKPDLVRLAEAASAGVMLAIRDGLEMVVVESLRPRAALVVSRVEVGSRLSLLRSALGRAYMAMLPQAERDDLLSQLRDAGQEDWAQSRAGFEAAMDEARTLGRCASMGEWHVEINTVGTAFRSPAGEIYAISCGGSPITQTRERLLQKVAPLMLECAETVSREMRGCSLASQATTEGAVS